MLCMHNTFFDFWTLFYVSYHLPDDNISLFSGFMLLFCIVLQGATILYRAPQFCIGRHNEFCVSTILFLTSGLCFMFPITCLMIIFHYLVVLCCYFALYYRAPQFCTGRHNFVLGATMNFVYPQYFF